MMKVRLSLVVLGLYKYFDMDDTVAAALHCVKKELD